ncbi:MAG: hypothetical protein LBD53_08775 [Tannerella sp.]|jgi:Spy/CpxP family protein refolding chaperone|nr:hypothetical protein [Tannerella sp.]
MKRIFSVSLMLLFACMMSLSAQDQGGQRRQGGQGGQGGQGRGGFNSEQRYEQLKKDLKLKDAQVDSLKSIDKDRRAEFQKARDANGGGGGDREAMRAAYQKMNEKYDARVKKVLTAEQYKKYNEQMEAMRQRGGQGGQGGQGGRRGGGGGGGQN